MEQAVPSTKPRSKFASADGDVVPERPDEPLDVNALYTQQEAAQYLRMSLRMVRRRLDTGHLGKIPIGRRRMITGRAILDYIEENEVVALPRHRRLDLNER
jgi:excisionase family DNA binding protein